MRPKVAIAIDYVIRIPDFIASYEMLKKEVAVGSFDESQHEVVAEQSKLVEGIEQADAKSLKESNKIEKDADALDVDKRNFWNELNEVEPKAAEFYKNTPTPKDNVGEDFDMTYAKYFYTTEHRLRFLQEFSYNLFGSGKATNKPDIDVINIAQTKLFDVVLFDRTPYARKLTNTLAFLARTGIFVKEILFTTTQKEIDDLKKECIGFWDPKTDATQTVGYPETAGKPTQKFLDWMMALESKKIEKPVPPPVEILTEGEIPPNPHKPILL